MCFRDTDRPTSQIYTGDSRPPIPPCVMALSAMGLKLGGLRVLPTTHAKMNTKQMHPQSSRTVRHFTFVYLHTQTAVDVGGIRTWRTTVNSKTPNLSPMLESRWRRFWDLRISMACLYHTDRYTINLSLNFKEQFIKSEILNDEFHS